MIKRNILLRSLTTLVFSILFIMGLTKGGEACPSIKAEKLKELMKSEDCLFIIDVRHPMEFLKGHIEKANLIPLGVFDYIYLSGLKNRTVVVYSEKGRRARVACQKLHDMGIMQTYNLEGGIEAWKSLGLPVIHGYK